MTANPCEGCGALCCRSLIIEIEHVDIVRESSLLPVVTPLDVDDDGQPGMYRLACGKSDPCKMLTADNQCSIYPTRPGVCVSFQPGGNKCNDLRDSAGLPPILKEE